MPPRWRSFPLPASRRRGAMYCRRTISTWALAARERAWRRKISRITAVRSSTSTPVAFSRLRACDGRDVVIDQHRLDGPPARQRRPAGVRGPRRRPRWRSSPSSPSSSSLRPRPRHRRSPRRCDRSAPAARPACRCRTALPDATSCAAGSPSRPRPPPACGQGGGARRSTPRTPGRRHREAEPRPRRHEEERAGCLTSAVSIGHAEQRAQTGADPGWPLSWPLGSWRTLGLDHPGGGSGPPHR